LSEAEAPRRRVAESRPVVVVAVVVVGGLEGEATAARPLLLLLLLQPDCTGRGRKACTGTITTIRGRKRRRLVVVVAMRVMMIFALKLAGPPESEREAKGSCTCVSQGDWCMRMERMARLFSLWCGED